MIGNEVKEMSTGLKYVLHDLEFTAVYDAYRKQTVIRVYRAGELLSKTIESDGGTYTETDLKVFAEVNAGRWNR